MTLMADEKTLPDSIERLYRAVSRLCDEPKQLIGGQLRVAPSLWDQLSGAVPGQVRREVLVATGRASSHPPLNVSALDLRDLIDATVAGWIDMQGTTAARLRAVATTKWSPSQVDAVDEMAAAVEYFVARCELVLGIAQRVRTLSAPCPSCGAQRVYRKDSAGETVRQPALQIVAGTGCTCLACGAFWAPDYYLHLARVLGYDLPQGVLE